MAHFPKPDQRVRAPRVRIPSDEPVRFSLGGKRVSGVLVLISRTGGLVKVMDTAHTGDLAELEIQSKAGPINALVELLAPVHKSSATMRPFRFVALNDEDQERLGSVIRHMQEQGNGVA